MKKINITVCTPTYNRGYLLERPFNSLMMQTNLNFIWLVIDDGSTDNTKEVIKSFKKKAPFEIKYFYKENGGRHTALNFSYTKMETDYVINLDSDDELTPTCIDDLYDIWRSIPKDEYERFWLISGRCAENISGKIVGQNWPYGINELKGKKQRVQINKYPGEKVNCRKVNVLKQFPFPVYDNIKFVTENTVWERINKIYDQYCVNNIFQTYYIDSTDGICNGGMHNNEIQRKSQLLYSIFCINELSDEFFYNRNVRRAYINLSRCSILSKHSFIKSVKELRLFYMKILVVLLFPIGYLMTLFYKGKNCE